MPACLLCLPELPFSVALTLPVPLQAIENYAPVPLHTELQPVRGLGTSGLCKLSDPDICHPLHVLGWLLWKETAAAFVLSRGSARCSLFVAHA